MKGKMGKEKHKVEHHGAKEVHHHHMKKGGKAMKKGGHVEGKEGKKRLDKYARGGATKGGNAESAVKSSAMKAGMSPLSVAGKMSGNIPMAKVDSENN